MNPSENADLELSACVLLKSTYDPNHAVRDGG